MYNVSFLLPAHVSLQCSVEESARDLTSFMNLFEKVLPRLLTPSYEEDNEENTTPPLLTTQPLTPVLGTHACGHTHT